MQGPRYSKYAYLCFVTEKYLSLKYWFQKVQESLLISEVSIRESVLCYVLVSKDSMKEPVLWHVVFWNLHQRSQCF